MHRDGRGVAVLTYVPAAEGGRLGAMDVHVLDPEAADAVVTDMPGWIVSGSPELGDQLAARGATVRRRLRIMTRSLRDDPPPRAWAQADLGTGRRAVPVDRDPADVFPAWRAAYGRAGHPDHFAGSDADALAQRLVPVLTGDEGVILPWSRLVVETPSERVLAGAVVIDVESLGPLLADVFRDPDPAYAGLGTALLQRVLAAGAQAGATEIGLAVSDGNRALGVYERLGFVTTKRLTTVVIPT
jgi:GNAT superfamily N-acetyltransferase